MGYIQIFAKKGRFLAAFYKCYSGKRGARSYAAIVRGYPA